MDLSTESFSLLQTSDRINQIVQSLHSYIIDDNVKPGTELQPERELAKRLGVSRFSLREALRVAQAQGLLEIRQGRRPRVASPSAAAAAEVIGLTLRRTKSTFLQLVAARELLELEIVRLAALNITPSDLEKLAKTISDMRENSDDLALCAEKDIEFHTVMLKASGNVVFEIMLLPVAKLLKESREKTLSFATGVARALECHGRILEELRRHDGEAAAREMKKHLEMVAEDQSQIE